MEVRIQVNRRGIVPGRHGRGIANPAACDGKVVMAFALAESANDLIVTSSDRMARLIPGNWACLR